MCLYRVIVHLIAPGAASASRETRVASSVVGLDAARLPAIRFPTETR
jgi:hypothetical protein